MPESANHNFIVTNASSSGDPKATIDSYGDVGNDTMGKDGEATSVNNGGAAGC